MKTYKIATKIGNLYVTCENEKIVRLESLQNGVAICNHKNDLIEKLKLQLDEYFNDKRKVFDLPIKLYGTLFQLKVWQALCQIPYGKTLTYKEVAEKIGNKKAFRAVGNACNKNPVMILVPCHRVIGTNGKLTGYAGGLELKERLLNLEKDSKWCKMSHGIKRDIFHKTKT